MMNFKPNNFLSQKTLFSVSAKLGVFIKRKIKSRPIGNVYRVIANIMCHSLQRLFYCLNYIFSTYGEKCFFGTKSCLAQTSFFSVSECCVKGFWSKTSRRGDQKIKKNANFSKTSVATPLRFGVSYTRHASYLYSNFHQDISTGSRDIEGSPCPKTICF